MSPGGYDGGMVSQHSALPGGQREGLLSQMRLHLNTQEVCI